LRETDVVAKAKKMPVSETNCASYLVLSCRLGNLSNCVAMDVYLLLGHGLGCCQPVIQKLQPGLELKCFL